MEAQVRVAWITGGSSGIGYAIAENLAEAGFTVVVSARKEPALRETCTALRARGGQADYVVMDTTVRSQVEQACRTILERHGRIDVLVNCAGFNVKARQWHDLDPAEFDAVLAGNLSGAFHAIHTVLPTMRHNRAGIIVNVASLAGKVVSIGGGVAYTVAKTGMITLTQSLNMAEFKNGIRACVVAPGEVATPAMARRAVPVPQADLDRMLKPEDVARAVRFAVEMPPHACIYEIDISPTWNRAWV
jgi:NAD(P)-dependent dehydrogenase (short-subunit alcohol dehydrogenase family)